LVSMAASSQAQACNPNPSTPPPLSPCSAIESAGLAPPRDKTPSQFQLARRMGRNGKIGEIMIGPAAAQRRGGRNVGVLCVASSVASLRTKPNRPLRSACFAAESGLAHA
jgi:hypothetical protein